MGRRTYRHVVFIGSPPYGLDKNKNEHRTSYSNPLCFLGDGVHNDGRIDHHIDPEVVEFCEANNVDILRKVFFSHSELYFSDDKTFLMFKMRFL